MRVLPSSGREWLSVLLFPFKTFTVLALIMLFIWNAVVPRGSLGTGAYGLGMFILPGYVVSSVVLLLGGVIQFCVGARDLALPTFLFGVAAVIILVLIAPMFVVA